MKRAPSKPKVKPAADAPFTARLPDGRTLFVLVPGRWCETDAGGELLLKPEAVRFIDRVQALAMETPAKPTPAYLRALREGLGLTQAEFAGRVGVDKMTIARWEWGQLSPRRAKVLVIDKIRKAAARQGVVIDTRAA